MKVTKKENESEIWNKCINRTDWDKGEWDDEHDFIQWIDPKTNLLCMMNRNSMGSWCGYVGVPKGHESYKKHYDLVEANCHGGLTYSGERKGIADWESLNIFENTLRHNYCTYGKGEYKDLWWVGFDCAHYMDDGPYDPIAKYAKIAGVPTIPRLGLGDKTYRNEAYVRQECTSLAKQLWRPSALELEVKKIRKEINAKKPKKK